MIGHTTIQVQVYQYLQRCRQGQALLETAAAGLADAKASPELGLVLSQDLAQAAQFVLMSQRKGKAPLFSCIQHVHCLCGHTASLILP